jgi:xanthine dehydrogenase accessory factor
MTHSYDYDLAVLEQILFQNIPYIGILGPKKKEQKLFRDLGEKGIVLTPQEKSRIFGPAGLDIGAETPEEIALSITAEIKKVLASGNGMSLREKKRSIHMAEEVNAGLFNRAIV